MDFIKRILKINGVAEPPYKYDFLSNLDEKEYPKYLAKIYEYRTDKKLPLQFCWNIFKISSRSALLCRQQHFGQWVIDKQKCKTFNEKIQYLKLYDNNELKRDCTDKVKVRDYVTEKIGATYLKPVLEICNNFNEIDFDKLPNQFVIKCNHGCKWHVIVKDKQKLLSNNRLFEKTKNKFTGWLNQEFWCFEGFELQYKNLEHKILIEPYMPSNRYIEIFCFNGIPKIYVDIRLEGKTRICTYNEDYSYSDLVLKEEDEEYMCNLEVDDILKQTVDLSKQLSKDFKFVRVDFMVNENKLYFEELTFSAYSGFSLMSEKWNRRLGGYLNI